MSYKEIAMQAIYDRYKKCPDDYPTHKPYTEEEKGAIDQLFEVPVLEQNKTTKNIELLKYDFY